MLINLYKIKGGNYEESFFSGINQFLFDWFIVF